MNIVKKIKQLDNKLFNNNIIKNNDTNYIIGLLVAILSSAILQNYVKPTYFMVCNITRVLFLITIIAICRHNFTLAIILSILYITLSNKTVLKSVENFTFYDADNDGDDDDDDDKPHPDEDPELEKLRKKALESEEYDRIIDVDEEDSYSVLSDSSDSGKKDSDNSCLINCLKDKRGVDECKHICENICDCSSDGKDVDSVDDKTDNTKQSSIDASTATDKDSNEKVTKKDTKKDNTKQTETSKSKKDKNKDDELTKEQNNLDRLKKILNDDN